jgi:adenosylmethionine-8-amino-7-oxononanoate aminotransferase
MLVCSAEGVVPDFLCLAKGLTAGYLPLAATLVQEEIYAAFLGSYASGRAFFHGHTFTGNPLAAAVALENIRKLRPLLADGIVRDRIACFGQRLESTLARHTGVREVRQRGLAAAVELEARSMERRVGLEVCLRAREHGLLLRPLGDSLLLVPPLCLTPSELGQLVDRTAAALADIYA